MDVREFEAIKRKVEVLKDKQSKASGAIEAIMASLKQYGCETIEEAQKLLTEKEQELEENESTLEALYTQLKGTTNWALI